jgi:hypothetical protein
VEAFGKRRGSASDPSAGTADALAERFAPLAIGMLDEIDDDDAIHYATQLYAAIANGQSVNAAHCPVKQRGTWLAVSTNCRTWLRHPTSFQAK